MAAADCSTSSTPPSSPSETEALVFHASAGDTRDHGVQRWVFASPQPTFAPGAGRYHSPRIYHTRVQSAGLVSSPFLTRSLSEDGGMHSAWRSVSHLNEGPPTSTSVMVTQTTRSPSNGSFQENHRVHSPGSGQHDTRNFRSSATSRSGSVGPFRTASILSDIRPGAIISRLSTRRSFGREWTRSHWEKVRDLEQESERARRCSKLSSGFAPLMVFGGLVFICIGVSAATNTGEDKERLQKLSAAPMAMGVFMLALGVFLIASWFGCRKRAKGLEQRLLHGSRRNSVDDNLVQNLIAKLSTSAGASRRQASSPTLPGVTLDGVNVLKPQSDKEARRTGLEQSEDVSDTSDCCSHCGASASHVVLETTI